MHSSREITVVRMATTSEVTIDSISSSCENTNCHHLKPNFVGSTWGTSYVSPKASTTMCISGP